MPSGLLACGMRQSLPLQVLWLLPPGLVRSCGLTRLVKSCGCSDSYPVPYPRSRQTAKGCPSDCWDDAGSGPRARSAARGSRGAAASATVTTLG